MEEEETRRREFREEMKSWNARYEKEKKEMEKWQREREDDRREREGDDSLEKFKQVMAELLRPLMTKAKKKKNVK